MKCRTCKEKMAFLLEPHKGVGLIRYLLKALSIPRLSDQLYDQLRFIVRLEVQMEMNRDLFGGYLPSVAREKEVEFGMLMSDYWVGRFSRKLASIGVDSGKVVPFQGN